MRWIDFIQGKRGDKKVKKKNSKIVGREQTKVGFRVPERNQEVQNSPKRIPERNQEVQNSPKQYRNETSNFRPKVSG